jgi:hypothetical protein
LCTNALDASSGGLPNALVVLVLSGSCQHVEGFSSSMQLVMQYCNKTAVRSRRFLPRYVPIEFCNFQPAIIGLQSIDILDCFRTQKRLLLFLNFAKFALLMSNPADVKQRMLTQYLTQNPNFMTGYSGHHQGPSHLLYRPDAAAPRHVPSAPPQSHRPKPALPPRPHSLWLGHHFRFSFHHRGLHGPPGRLP